MSRLHIHGIGHCTMGEAEPFKEGTGRLEDVPIKDYAKPALRRRYGRVARLMYIAALRAIKDAGIEDPTVLDVVASTALGEVKTSLDLVTQIHEKKGALISPALVPNSVHNAPAGHLTIGIKDRNPAITVSQGWLCAEAAISTVGDLFAISGSEIALAVIGDEADPAWIERLEELGNRELAQELADESFQEGAVALIVGTKPGKKKLGSIETGLERRDGDYSREIVERFSKNFGDNLEVRVREGAGGAKLSKIVEATIDGPGVGTSQIGAMAVLLERMKDPSCTNLLLIGREVDEIGWLHWMR